MNKLDYKIVKKSIDARYKPELFYIYELDIKYRDAKMNGDNLRSEKNKLSPTVLHEIKKGERLHFVFHAVLLCVLVMLLGMDARCASLVWQA